MLFCQECGKIEEFCETWIAEFAVVQDDVFEDNGEIQQRHTDYRVCAKCAEDHQVQAVEHFLGSNKAKATYTEEGTGFLGYANGKPGRDFKSMYTYTVDEVHKI